MAAPTIGTPWFQGTPRLQFVKGYGWTIIVPYSGTKAALDAINLGNALQVNRSGEGPILSLEASYSAASDGSGALDPDAVTIDWRFDYDKTEKSVFSMCSDDWMAGSLKYMIGEVESGAMDVDDVLQWILDNGGTGDDQEVLGLYMKGVDGYPVSYEILSKTVIFDKYSFNTAPSYANINRVFTTAALLDDEPSLADEPVSLNPDVLWLKDGPRTDKAGGGKYQLTQQWTRVDDYSVFLYGALIDV